MCVSCGDCIPGCTEQALELVDIPKGKKARMVGEIYCDDLAACIGHRPTGALTVEEREAEVYDDAATVERIEQAAPDKLDEHEVHMAEHSSKFARSGCCGGCPPAQIQQ